MDPGTQAPGTGVTHTANRNQPGRKQEGSESFYMSREEDYSSFIFSITPPLYFPPFLCAPGSVGRSKLNLIKAVFLCYAIERMWFFLKNSEGSLLFSMLNLKIISKDKHTEGQILCYEEDHLWTPRARTNQSSQGLGFCTSEVRWLPQKNLIPNVLPSSDIL